MRPSCARRGTRATARRSHGGAATPRAPGWRAGSPRPCRTRARSGSPARAGCDGRRRRSGRSARSAGTSARARRRGGRSCPTGERARRSSPGSGGGRGRGRAPRGSLRARSVSAPAGVPAGSPRQAHGRSAPTPSRSRSCRPGRAALRVAVAAARAGTVSAACSAYSGPSWAISIGLCAVASGWAQIRAGSSARRILLGIVTLSALPTGSAPTQSGGAYPGSSQTDLSPQGPLAVFGLAGSTIHSLLPLASSSSNWYSKRATSGAGAASSHDLPRRFSSCGSRSPSSWARRTAVRRRRGSGSWKRISITGVCRLRANSRAEPAFRDGSGRFGH